jgi:DNA polymerase
MLHIDFETRSPVDLMDCGAEVYAEHPLTEVLCMSYAFGDEAPRTWVPGEPFPQRVLDHMDAKHPVGAHNAAFERAIWRHVLRYDVEPVWVCSMALCGYRGLPLGLDQAAAALGLDLGKDKTGQAVMRKLSKPAKPTKKEPGRFWVKPTDEDRLALAAYCEQDVELERALVRALGKLTPMLAREADATDRMNLRGVKVDIPTATAAASILEQVQGKLRGQLEALTGGAVERETQGARMLVWLEGQGCRLPNLQAETVEKAISTARGVAREALELRARLAKASNHKIAAMLRATCEDGRARNLIQFHGATTGRDAGRLIQPQNFPRPDDAFEKWDDDQWEDLCQIVRRGDADLLEMCYGDPLSVLSNALRAMLTCEDDRELVAADLAGIENRVIAAYGGEDWKLDAFRDIDKNGGRDIYCRAADKVFGFEVNKKDHPTERQIGKVLELAAGYQGWVNAWRQFDSSDKHSDDDVARYMAAWRDQHPGIVQFWRSLEAAAIRAVVTGQPVETHGLVFQVQGAWLSLRLPSGRMLWYRDAVVEKRPHRYEEDREELVVVYWAYRYGQWRRIEAYGGLWAENVTQATARDILFPAAVAAEALGWCPVLRVHDEVVLEPPKGLVTERELCSLMTTAPRWAEDMRIPLAASGWVGRRYRK